MRPFASGFGFRRPLATLGVLLGSCLLLSARTFTVSTYNVENLFDIDGVAVYDDYQPTKYGAPELRTKIHNIAQVVRHIGTTGQGPDVLFLEEVEVDQTPSSATANVRALVDAQAGTTADKMLKAPVAKEFADWPAEAWLLKALEDAGVKGYTVIAGEDSSASPYEDGHKRAIKCVVMTRLPVKAVRNYPIQNARNILEIQVEVDGAPLYLFANHWKSGAGDVQTERIRVQNAQVLRSRLDEIFAKDPHADVIIAGDFNSQYNQKARYPQMGQTGINDVLHSQGDELALRTGKADLYNLWYELPPEQRGSDTFRGEWGTLMQIIVSRGLFDYRGIQYVDKSFTIVRIPSLNENADGTPFRWNGDVPGGAGCSDHFPVVATFTTVADNDENRWLEIPHPSDGSTPTQNPRVKAPHKHIPQPLPTPVPVPAGTDLRADGSWVGKIIDVSGTAVAGKRLAVIFQGVEYEVFAPDETFREKLREKWVQGAKVHFLGEFGQYKGHWQFVLREPEWLVAVE